MCSDRMSRGKLTHRSWLAFCLATFLGPPALPILAQADPQVPYLARVTAGGATVYSGPGTIHYATDRLEPGVTVEVYSHDPGDWAAIRPPQGSFSLVMASDVALSNGSLATVVNPQARAWVGTRLSAVEEPMWQVQLDQGEALEVLGMVDRDTYQLGRDEPDWLQVAPPPGEFRWIKQSDLAFVEPLSNVGDSAELTVSPATQLSISWPASSSPPVVDQATDWSVDTTQGAPRANNNGWKPVKGRFANAQERSQFIADERFSLQLSSHWNSSSPITPAVQQAPAIQPMASAPSSVTAGSPPPSEALEQLELQLTREMLKPPQQWDLRFLGDQAQAIQAQQADRQVRSAATRLLEKIQRCREIQAGMRAVGNSQAHPVPSTIRSAQPQLIGSNAVGSGVDRGVQTVSGEMQLAGNYDAVGWLNELARDGGVGPTTYVLQDDDGEITHHVAPVMGLNLHRYLKQKIGVIGNRGFHQKFNLDHVTAERVITLDRVRR